MAASSSRSQTKLGIDLGQHNLDIKDFGLTMVALVPGPSSPPRCCGCSKLGSLEITRASNRKKNAGRPYYKCHGCRKFLCFADERGNDATNPDCNCGVSSKRQMSGPDTRVPRGLHYVCRLGECDFYMAMPNDSGGQVQLSEVLVDEFVRLKLV